jgi:hypothetical protein
MILTIRPTPEFFRIDEGWPVRAWTGETNGGIAVTVFVAAICSDAANQPDLEAALEEIPGPKTVSSVGPRSDRMTTRTIPTTASGS